MFIRVTFLVDRLSGSARLLADHFAFLVSLVFCVVFLWATAVQGFRGLHDDTELSTLPILVGPAYCLVPIGFLALTILMLTKKIPEPIVILAAGAIGVVLHGVAR